MQKSDWLTMRCRNGPYGLAYTRDADNSNFRKYKVTETQSHNLKKAIQDLIDQQGCPKRSLAATATTVVFH